MRVLSYDVPSTEGVSTSSGISNDASISLNADVEASLYVVLVAPVRILYKPHLFGWLRRGISNRQQVTYM